MSLLRQFIQRPQKVWLRRALFQIHLWLGLILAIYLIAIGLTGSILVFKAEAVESLTVRPAQPLARDAPQAPLSSVLQQLRNAYPRHRLGLVLFPTPEFPVYQTVAMAKGKYIVSSHPTTGAIVGDVNLTKSWLGFVHNLHIFLLVENGGFEANGVGAILLLVLCISGLVLWWPGIRKWKSAFLVSMRSGWKRINWDLHNTVGFYLLALVTFWSVSTIYFVWEKPVTQAINAVSPVTIERPKVRIPEHGGTTERADVDAMLARARAMRPDLTAIGIGPAATTKVPFTVFMIAPGARHENNAEPPDGAVRVCFDPVTGEHVATIVPPVNRTAGDWLVWSMKPFHFGDEWGFAMKVVWATLGLSIPLLTITGVLMYWNRYLAKLWRRLRQRTASRSGNVNRRKDALATARAAVSWQREHD